MSQLLETVKKEVEVVNSNPDYEESFLVNGLSSVDLFSLSSILRESHGVEIPFSQFFSDTSISDFVRKNESQTNINICKTNMIRKFPKREKYPLLPNQKSMFYFHKYCKKVPVCNISLLFKIKGTLNIQKAEDAIDEILYRHSILRTSFKFENGELFQKIHNKVQLKIKKMKYDDDNIEKHVSEVNKTYSLDKAPLLRFINIECRSNSFLYIDIHHIISDAKSVDILLYEFSELYKGNKLPVLLFQYKDYIQHIEEVRKHNSYVSQVKFWEKYFDQKLPFIEQLQIESSTPQGFQASEFIHEINPETAKRIEAFSSNNSVTVYTFLISIYIKILHNIFNNKGFCIAVPYSGRNSRKYDNQIGLYMKYLFIRGYFDNDIPILDLLNQTKKSIGLIFDNKDAFFEDFNSELKGKRVFQSIFNYIDVGDSSSAFLNYDLGTESKLERMDMGTSYSMAPISLFVIKTGDIFQLKLKYTQQLPCKDDIGVFISEYMLELEEALNIDNLKTKN
jgi:hypothetical protein